MKKVVIAVIVLVIIVTAGVLETVYVHKVFDTLDEQLVELDLLIKDKDDGALQLTKDLSKWWSKKRGYLELFTFSPDLRAFSVALAEAEGSLECGDFDNALSKCQSLIVMSKNIHMILDFNATDII